MYSSGCSLRSSGEKDAMSCGRKLRSILLVCMMIALSFLSTSCSEEKPKLTGGKVVYEFLANAKSAEIADYNRERVVFGQEFTINKEKRSILFEHPNAEVRFNTVAIPQNAVLQFGIGINPEAWDKGGDGVTFEITVVDEKSAKTMIFSGYIDPKANPGERKWIDHEVDLKDFAGKKVAFIFTTTLGPRGDGTYDWAGWSSPRIRLRENAG